MNREQKIKIHLISDIHLESGSCPMPEGIDADVIVAAGDIGIDLIGIEWLKKLGRPVVHVLGNHEYWNSDGVEMMDVLASVKEAAALSNVVVLENESVVIDRIRFIGSTLWTNYGNWNAQLVDHADAIMYDPIYIRCKNLYDDPANQSTIHALVTKLAEGLQQDTAEFHEFFDREYRATGRFHPVAGYLINQRSLEFIKSELKKTGEFDSSIVVTHMHPSYESLLRYGISALDLQPPFREYSQGDLYKVAAYASDLLVAWDGPKPVLWCAGHLHKKMDYIGENGTRVVCNPCDVSKGGSIVIEI